MVDAGAGRGRDREAAHGVPVTEALPRRHEVRREAVVLVPEPPAGPPDPRGDLVRHDDPARGTHAPDELGDQILRREPDEAGRAAGLEDERGDVVERHIIDAPSGLPVHVDPLLVAARARAAERGQIAGLHGEEPWPTRDGPGELRSELHRLAAGAQEDALAARQVSGGHHPLCRALNDGVVPVEPGVHELAGLTPDRLRHGRVNVAERRAPDAGLQVQPFVTAAVDETAVARPAYVGDQGRVPCAEEDVLHELFPRRRRFRAAATYLAPGVERAGGGHHDRRGGGRLARPATLRSACTSRPSCCSGPS
jgi:hypothetical protein